jgi:multidrug efflux pump
MTSIQLPSDATTERTLEVVKTFEAAATRPGIASTSRSSASASRAGPNAAIIFSNMKDWDERDGATAAEEVALAQAAMAHTRGHGDEPDAAGHRRTGHLVRLQHAPAGPGQPGLRRPHEGAGRPARDGCQARPLQWPTRKGSPRASVRLDIDRQKAEALGVSFASISDTLSTAMGSLYVNDFPNAGRMQQVIIQADARARMQVEDILKLYVRNNAGGMVPLGEVVTPVWTDAPLQLMRYKGYPAVRIAGSAAPGVSSGEAMAAMEAWWRSCRRICGRMDGQSLQERESAAQAPMLIALSMLVVFLVLAALYESWAIPLSVMLVIPGLIGAVLAVSLRGMPNDVFFKVGHDHGHRPVAKNAILIIEFAKQLREQGMT